MLQLAPQASMVPELDPSQASVAESVPCQDLAMELVPSQASVVVSRECQAPLASEFQAFQALAA